MNRVVPWLVGAVAAYIIVRTAMMLAAAWPFDTDDAYITLRYARHLADGDGIVWNVGESPPVEGYSNFLLVLIGALSIKLGLEPMAVLKVIGVAALACTCGLLWVLARRWVGPLAATVPPLVLTAYQGTINWTVSGLETSLYQALAVGAVTALVIALGYPRTGQPVCAPSLRHLILSALLVFAASITRPEGPLLGLAIGAALLVHLYRPRGGATFASKARPLLAFGISFALPYGLYFAWRLFYFDRLLPNSVHCKGMQVDESLALLLEYRALVLPYLAFALFQYPRSLDARFVALLGIPALYIAVLYRVDPIVGHLNRHVLTAWALLLVPATIGLTNAIALLPRLALIAREWIAVAIALAWSACGVASGLDTIADDARHYEARMTDRYAVGHWLASHLQPGEAYLLGDCGLIPFVAGGHAIDAFCLNNLEMTTPPIKGSQARSIDHIFSARPAYMVVHSSHPTELRPRPEYGFYRALTSHPAFIAYELVAKFGNAESTFHYWIYRLGPTRIDG